MRITTIAMAAVLCFGVIVPRAIAQHRVLLATGVALLFACYAVANVLAWRRMKATR